MPQDILDISQMIDDNTNYGTENAPEVNFLNVKTPRQKSMRIEEVYKDSGGSDMVKFNVYFFVI